MERFLDWWNFEPFTVIEQFTYLLFIRRLDEIQLTKEKQANLVGIAIKDPVYAEDEKPLSRTN